MSRKSSENEEQYFMEQEAARLRKLREEHLAKMAAEQRRSQKELHYMHCAKCGQKMETTTMVGVDIEVCPDCGGMYLDAGELSKLMAESERKPFIDALLRFRRLWGG